MLPAIDYLNWSVSLLYTVVRKLLLDLDSQCFINCVCLQMLEKIKELKYCLLLPSGFNVAETVEHRSLKFTLWDVGGLQKLRPLWGHYHLNTQGSY